jgi:preprotein translocase subunit YajC
MDFLLILAEASEGGGSQQPQGGGWDVMLMMLVPIILIFWLMSRSQKKKENERKDMLSRIKKGDHVITVGGLHGEVIRINEKEAVLLVDKSKNVELRFQRVSIAGLAGTKDEAGQNNGTKQEGGS